MTQLTPAHVVDDVRETASRIHSGDMQAGALAGIQLVADALRDAGLLNMMRSGYRPIREARQDGTPYICFGQHVQDAPLGASPQVRAGDLWVAVLIWDKWRASPIGQRWVFSLNGAPAWSDPLLFRTVDYPTLEEMALVQRLAS